MTTPIFDAEKSLEAMLFVANRLKRKDFHKIFKVLYFADREHLFRYGRPITGDTYIAMKDGPVPSKIDDIFKAVRGDSYFAKVSDIVKLSDVFVVHDWYFIEPKRDANMDYLSKSDVEVLTESLDKYGSLSWYEIREKSHDYAWKATAKDRQMSIEDIMRESGAEEDYIDYVVDDIMFEKELNAC